MSALRVLVISLSLCFGVWSCSKKEDDDSPLSPEAEVTTIEREFSLAGDTNNVPARFLLAMAYLESHIAEKPTHTELQGQRIIAPTGGTAFGLSRAVLELPAETGIDLQTQSEAYARWVSQNVERLLVRDPQSIEEKMQWVLELAGLHRKTPDTQALFARELIALLNKGFTWYDPRRHEFLQFAPESPSIEIAQLSKAHQNRLNVVLKSAETTSARTLLLPNRPSQSIKQVPTHIELVHCPFSLSACLDLQIEENGTQKFALGAHYAIAQNSELVDFPLQLTLHEDSVAYTGRDGTITHSSDAIRIMLVGYSGRISASKRQIINPDWMSKWQLQTMGVLVGELCAMLDKKRTEPLPHDGSYQCTTIGQGVRIASPTGDQPYSWGDIFDYDAQIFTSYLGKNERVVDETKFILADQQQIVEAGEVISLGLEFNPEALHLELARLRRCPDGTPIWSAVERGEVQGDTSYQFYNKRYWDAGVNGTGEQFFRTKIFGKDDKFLGWDITRLMVKNFQQGYTPLPPEECGAGK